MSEKKSALRERITPVVHFVLEVEDADGGKFEQHFKIAYDLNAMALFEEVTGANMFRDIGRILSDRSISTCTALFWSGIQLHHPEYAGSNGLRIVRSNLTYPTIAPVMLACVEAFMSQLPKETVDRLKGNNKDPLAQGAAQETSAS